MHCNVFISYSRKDSVIAHSLCAALDKAEISYFIDREGISGGEDFPKVISEAILDCDVFLYLASKNSYDSKFTGSEVTYAYNHKKKTQLLPFIIDGSPLPPNLEFLFSDINIRNIKDHPIEPTLVEDVRAILDQSEREMSKKRNFRKSLCYSIVAAVVLILSAIWFAPGPRFLRSEDSVRQFLSSHKFEAVNNMSFHFTEDLSGICFRTDTQVDDNMTQLKALWTEDLIRYQEQYEEYRRELNNENITVRTRQRLQEKLEDVAEQIRETHNNINELNGITKLENLQISVLTKRSAQVYVLYESGGSMTYILGIERGKAYMAPKTGANDIGMKFYAK